MKEIDMYTQLAKLKEIDYKNTLAIISIIETLIDKGIITSTDIARKSAEIEREMTYESQVFN
ncbi:MAG: hypothetical protein QME46_00090 [Thermoanaerobacteraceae bacterium]|nr:hypothetical protein [Thermoanaerobacteraceae bacterium]